MKAITKGWPPERRKAQAENIRRTRPWLRATGPKTPEGKAKISKNARKHYDARSAAFRFVKDALYAQRKFRRLVTPLVTKNLTQNEYKLLSNAISNSKAYQDLQRFIASAHFNYKRRLWENRYSYEWDECSEISAAA